jgi:hypothetical protein
MAISVGFNAFLLQLPLLNKTGHVFPVFQISDCQSSYATGLVKQYKIGFKKNRLVLVILLKISKNS